jgi:hypothetical protein
MARFKESNILQGQFIVVNLSKQLIPGTYEWTLNYLNSGVYFNKQ